jgi:tRNA(fMet)-specific endonuclease VapC
MSLYILDTDHVSMWLENQPNVRRNVEIFNSEIAITIVTVQEIFNGWIVKLNHPSTTHQQVQLYGKLSRVVAYLKKMVVLDFNESADKVLIQLLLENPPLRKNRVQKDMRIASIALLNNATIVTRNHRDFAQVPNLKVLDWSA